jgi:hypothetical protein
MMFGKLEMRRETVVGSEVFVGLMIASCSTKACIRLQMIRTHTSQNQMRLRWLTQIASDQPQGLTQRGVID